MTAKKLIGIRASDLTVRQIMELTEALGMNQTEVITLAVDRLYQSEIARSGSREEDEEDGVHQDP